MKITTWNVNSLNVRLPHVLRWLDEAAPDVLALQETKLEDVRFPAQAFADAGLDADRAVREMNSNSHFQSMIRGSCAHLMEFLDEVGLLTRPAMHYYRKANML